MATTIANNPLSLLVETRAFLLHNRRADLIAGELYPEPEIARYCAFHSYPIYHFTLDGELLDRIEDQVLALGLDLGRTAGAGERGPLGKRGDDCHVGADT